MSCPCHAICHFLFSDDMTCENVLNQLFNCKCRLSCYMMAEGSSYSTIPYECRQGDLSKPSKGVIAREATVQPAACYYREAMMSGVVGWGGNCGVMVTIATPSVGGTPAAASRPTSPHRATERRRRFRRVRKARDII
ncbi:hypothetical protein J6590_032643 [Homalodisca vitripennis]|nr:hypothetical protein J6590_032643 [Homalodisca vitripennis]